MSIETVNDETFAARIQPEGTTLVEFGAEWCPPCKTLLPMLGELSNEQGSIGPLSASRLRRIPGDGKQVPGDVRADGDRVPGRRARREAGRLAAEKRV